jgi:hypothetical protein
VLALSISQTGYRTPKDSGGVNHHYKRSRKSRANKEQVNLPLFNIEMMTTQMTCERKKEVG